MTLAIGDHRDRSSTACFVDEFGSVTMVAGQRRERKVRFHPVGRQRDTHDVEVRYRFVEYGWHVRDRGATGVTKHLGEPHGLSGGQREPWSSLAGRRNLHCLKSIGGDLLEHRTRQLTTATSALWLMDEDSDGQTRSIGWSHANE